MEYGLRADLAGIVLALTGGLLVAGDSRAHQDSDCHSRGDHGRLQPSSHREECEATLGESYLYCCQAWRPPAPSSNPAFGLAYTHPPALSDWVRHDDSHFFPAAPPSTHRDDPGHTE